MVRVRFRGEPGVRVTGEYRVRLSVRGDRMSMLGLG